MGILHNLNSNIVILILICCEILYATNAESNCTWSHCYFASSTTPPCPQNYTATNSKSCYYSGVMYQCCSNCSPEDVTTSMPTSKATTLASTTEATTESYNTPAVTEEVIPETTTQESVNLFQCSIVTGGAFPFMVALIEHTDGGRVHFCGGAILSEWYVITSASCLIDKIPSKVKVSAANLNLTQFEFTEQTILVKNFHIHEDFHVGDAFRHSDVALLELEQPFEFWIYNAESVGPIPIAQDSAVADVGGNSGTVAGWAMRDLDVDDTQEENSILRKVDIPFIPRNTCAQMYRDLAEPRGEEKIDNAKQLCAASSTTHKECIEDHGSPLVYRDSNGVKYIVGISSLFSESFQIPNVYTDVTYFRNWIETKIINP